MPKVLVAAFLAGVWLCGSPPVPLDHVGAEPVLERARATGKS
jgi:hypothetical protein